MAGPTDLPKWHLHKPTFGSFLPKPRISGTWRADLLFCSVAYASRKKLWRKELSRELPRVSFRGLALNAVWIAPRRTGRTKCCKHAEVDCPHHQDVETEAREQGTYPDL